MGGEEVVAEQVVTDPDDLSQAIHYQGYLDESLYTMWNTDWNDCDFDGDGIKDRIYREINDSETEITYRIDFGNGEEFEIAKTGDYFMYLKIQAADICGDVNNEILFVGEHTASTMPHADVMLFGKTEESYKEISLIYPKEWFGNNDGTVYMYSGDEPITDALGPTTDFVEQFDWNFWCENEAMKQLHFGTKEECGGTTSDAEFINFNGKPCVIIYFNIGDKWLYKDIGLVFQINEYKESEMGREVILEKIVPDPLQNNEIISVDKITEELTLEIDVSEHYITNIGDPSNLYHIDDNNVLWGCGKNQYGQLGQGTKDEEFHEEMVKIAENVIHVDYSQKGFVIYLTEDKKLYGLGNGASGTLSQLASYSEEVFYSYDEYSVTSPKLLLEDVEYARCGRSDIVAMKTDDSIWVWGLIWCRNAQTFCYQGWPVKVLENGALVTGSFYNHAALLKDGSVWTWGHNYSGNCGVEAMPEISTPQKVAENVVMVWTGNIDRNVEYNDIADFEGEYPRDMENTIIKKSDGSYWICGANVGNTPKVLPVYYEASDYEMVCSYEFIPYNKALIGDE